MVVVWKVPIGAHLGCRRARRHDQVYVAADDCVTVLAGCAIAARIPVGPDTKRLIVGADGVFLYGVLHQPCRSNGKQLMCLAIRAVPRRGRGRCRTASADVRLSHRLSGPRRGDTSDESSVTRLQTGAVA
jgi:hypothetical protein